MTRGMYQSITSSELYQQQEKEWCIELTQTTIYWYDQLVNSETPYDTKKHAKEQLYYVKKELKENLDKRFIYFIIKRPKVRFNIKRQPHKALFSDKLKIHFLVGRKKKNVSVSGKLYCNGRKVTSATVDEKFIKLYLSEEDQIVMTVHDFLKDNDINICGASKVEYVGITKNPDIRPTNGSHSGLSYVQHNVSNEEYDIFICFNLFKVIAQSVGFPEKGNFWIANSLSNEVDADLEGLIIEKCFILYFDSQNQMANKKSEKKEFIHNLIKLNEENKIRSVEMFYEFDGLSEYYHFFSDAIKPRKQHCFSFKVEENELKIAKDTGNYRYSEPSRNPVIVPPLSKTIG